MSDQEPCPCNVKTSGPYCGDGPPHWICTLPPGHSGEHVACALPDGHRVHVWPNESESAPETVTIPRADLERVREAIPLPLVIAGNANAMAFHLEARGCTGITPEALTAWLRSLSKQLTELNNALALPMFRKEEE